MEGISLVSDKIGLVNENDFSVDLSYTIQTFGESKLSFGLKGTANLFNLNIAKLNSEN